MVDLNKQHQFQVRRRDFKMRTEALFWGTFESFKLLLTLEYCFAM